MIKYTRQINDVTVTLEVETVEELRQVLNVIDVIDEDTDSDGWVKHDGSGIPVADEVMVQTVYSYETKEDFDPVVMKADQHDKWWGPDVVYGINYYRIVSEADA